MLIRVAQQPGGEQAQQAAIAKVREALGNEVDYRRVEVVGPRVSTELLANSTIGLGLAIFAILIYLWFRFEWQFALGAMIANVHDLVLTIGYMSLTQIDFDLSSIAALLTILGYSLNDTVVIYDRIREMLRRYKRMSMPDLLNISVNSTLSRSIITHVTVTLALLALLFFGGHAIHSFVATMIFGVVLVGTYTSVFIAAPILIYLGVGTTRLEAAETAEKRPAAHHDRVRRRNGPLKPSMPMQDAFAHCETLVRAADRDRFLATLFRAGRTARGAVRALRLQHRDCAGARGRARAAGGRDPAAMVDRSC